MRRARTGRALVAAALAIAGAAAASAPAPAVAQAQTGPCPEGGAATAGPLPGGTGPADFGAVPEACPALELALRLRGTLLVASGAPDFFGAVSAGGMLRARLPVGARAWISLALDAATYRYVANAVVTSSGASFGPPTLGFYRSVGHRDDLALALYARALLPLDTARHNGVEAGLEVGGAARFSYGTRLGLDGGLALAAPVDVVGGQVHAAFRPAALVEGWWSPARAVAIFAGGSARFEAAPEPALVSVAPRAAVRFALPLRIWLAALAEVPLVGDDRTDLVAGLYAGWAAQ